ncbi:MAG: hypothetical protein J6J23_01715 [Clostridia bacterium]|nr:hypothetical protein [Clostridia bacterium]
MKRLFRLGGGLFICSIIPILSWIVLSFVVGDNRVSNVFSIVYAIQFVGMILRSLFGSGANIRHEREKDQNAVWNGILWGVVFSVLIFTVLIIFVDEYIIFFGQDVGFYRNYVIYGFLLILLQTLLSFIIEKLYFEDKERLATIHLFGFNFVGFIVLILSSLIIKNTLIALILTSCILLIYVIGLYAWQFEKFKIDFKFYKNFKYESANIMSSIFMMIIYLFGYRTVFDWGEEYIVAINLITLCTDTQWDMQEAIRTVAKVDIAKGRYDIKRELTNSYIYTTFLVITSVIMFFVLFPSRNVRLGVCLIYLTIQFIDMFLYCFEMIIATFTQLEYSAKLNTFIKIVLLGVRTLISVLLISPYCTEIAQLVQCVLGFVIFLIVRSLRYKVEGNKLIVKSKDIKKIPT